MSDWSTQRPHGVPETATYDDPSETWRLGSVKEGHFQIWHPCGTRIFDASFKAGVLDGTVRLKVMGQFRDYGTDHYAFCLGLMKEFGLPDGDSLSQLRAEYREGRLVAVKFLLFMDENEETEKLSATFHDGKLERLIWQVAADSDIFSYGKQVIKRSAMKIPKPHPASIELRFTKGKVTSRAYFDRDGKEFAPKPKPTKVTQWGQETTPKDLAGYITSGRFLADLETFFPDAEPDTCDPDAVRAENAFIRLPKLHRASALAFDQIAKNGFPTLTRSSLSGYGFDCLKNELDAATDDRYFGLSYTSDSDLQLLDLETGQVLEWVHDYDPFEEDAIFPNLDVYAFAIIRIELAAQKRIPKVKAKALFKQLGVEWCAKLI